MNRGITIGALALSTLAATLPAVASDGQLIAAGYSAPGPMEVAPGQVLTLFFRGIGRMPDGSLRIGQAQTVPLPETLAGLSASIQQLPQTTPFPLPLLSVRQHNECEDASGQPKCLLTAIRVQIPTELTPVVAKLTVDADGQASRTFLIRPVRDDAHVLTACDLTWDTNPASSCGRMAFHGDGTPVNEARPARRGETIVIYAYGLGPTVPRVPAGIAAPAGVEVVDGVARQLAVRFLPFRNASPSLPRYFEAEPVGTVGELAFAGLTAGQVGLYQVNVKVPESVEIPILCGGDTRSNVLAKVASARGIENLPLCVEP
jgi:uncharacterized protein (TIGR03437 family)